MGRVYDYGSSYFGVFGDGWDAEVDGGGVAGAPLELGELVVGAGEADLEALDLAQPALAFGFGDAGQQVVADLHQPVALGWVWPQERTPDTCVFMNAGRSERAGARPDGHLPLLKISLHQASRHVGCAVYCLGVTYYLTHAPGGAGFFGVPDPAVGARVVFDAERLFAARERRLGRPVARELHGDEGLVVLEDPMEALTWPCRLWRVDDLEGAVRLQPSNRWLRCQAVTVCEELPGWLVLGPCGDAVVRVIEQARRLTSAQVNAIAAMGGDDEQGLYRAAWDRWLRTRRSGSPVGVGLSAVWRAVEEAARRTSPALFGWDEEDEVEVLTDPAWLQAGHAATAAALAFGAPDLLKTGEHERLATRWVSVMGRPGSWG